VNGLDFILVIILIIGAAGGYQKGFLYSLFSLLAVFLGVLGGFKLMGIVMVRLSHHLDMDNRILPYVAFAIVFLLIVIIVRLVGSLLRASLEKSVFGQADQVAGAALGALKTVFMLSVIFWILDSVSFQLPGHWQDNSALYGFTANFAPKTTQWIGEYVPAFSGVFKNAAN